MTGAPAWGALGVSAGCSALAVLVLLLVTWSVGRVQRRHAVMDVAWGLGFVLVAAVSWVVTGSLSDPDRARGWLLLILTATWGLRLAGHLAWRLRGGEEDPRYAELLEGEGRDRAALRRVYLPQGLALLVVSMVLPVGMVASAPVGVLTWVGVGLWAVGMFFEIVGDAQLAAHKADPERRGTVLDTGVWRLTRHPNYFGDATVWWGLWLVTASAGVLPALLALPAPLLMTWTLTSRTGRPLTEERMAGRPGYAEYVARTSSFVPWPPRRAV